MNILLLNILLKFFNSFYKRDIKMFNQKIFVKIKGMTHKVENVMGQQIVTDVSEYLNKQNNKKYAVKKKIIPALTP